MANAQALMVHETFNLAQMLLGLHPILAVSDEMFHCREIFAWTPLNREWCAKRLTLECPEGCKERMSLAMLPNCKNWSSPMAMKGKRRTEKDDVFPSMMLFTTLLKIHPLKSCVSCEMSGLSLLHPFLAGLHERTSSRPGLSLHELWLQSESWPSNRCFWKTVSLGVI